MADSKKYIGIYDTLEDVQDALDNGQLSKPYVAKTMDNGQIDYNSLSPVDYSQYWCTYYPIDAKIWVQTSPDGWYDRTEYTKGDGKISKADFPDFYLAGSTSGIGSTVTKFKYFQFDSTSTTTSFYYAWKNCSSLTEFPMLDVSKGTDFGDAWNGCTNLREFPALNLSKGVNFNQSWYGCSSLTEFPMLDVSSGIDFGGAWFGCSNIASFPALNLSKGTRFNRTWTGCSSLTEFPMIDTSSGTDFSDAWNGCQSLKEFPQLDLSSGTNFGGAWNRCSALTTLPAMDLSGGINFNNTWVYCSSLTTLGGFGAIKESIDLSTSPNLTVDSLMNVINQAATVEGKTMTFGSTNLNKLTDEQKAVATSKGWTLA